MSTAPGTPKKLVRSREDKWLSGVCGGIAEYTGIDVTLIRIVVLVGTIVGFGSLLVAYVVAWILMPSVDRVQPPVVIHQPAPQPGTPPEPPTPSA